MTAVFEMNEHFQSKACFYLPMLVCNGGTDSTSDNITLGNTKKGLIMDGAHSAIVDNAFSEQLRPVLLVCVVSNAIQFKGRSACYNQHLDLT